MAKKNKIKTNKTLRKRTKISKTGKIIKKQVCMGHLKEKKSNPRITRKNQRKVQTNKGHRASFKRMLGKHGGKIK